MDILMIILLGCVARRLTQWYVNVVILLAQMKHSALVGYVARCLTQNNFIGNIITTIDVEKLGSCDGSV